MEKLIVSNFLNLKHIELDLAKITIIIGSQAQGKSVLAKLVFFFKDIINNYIRKPKSTDEQITNVALKDFWQIFPYYAWENQDFEIVYQWEDIKISLIKKNTDKPILKFSDNFEIIKKNISSTELVPYPIQSPIFIPSNRSFFANIQNNIFLLLSEDISIDYFLKRFGKFYQRIKIQLEKLKNTPPWDRGTLDLNEEAEKFFNKIIIGNYRYEKGEDWIYFQDGTRINLINASSGQQEALPIILILFFPGPRNRLFLIEEPEAHLFPTSQKYIVELISLAFNDIRHQKSNKFFITTHSPYILTAFNNLIQAGNTLKAIEQKKNHEFEREKLFEIVPKNQILDINDIGVYSLENGEIKSILNQENQLIDINIIDEVSNQLSEEFQQLLDLELEGA